MIIGIRSKKAEVESIIKNSTTKVKDEDFKSMIDSVSATKRKSTLEETKSKELNNDRTNYTLNNNSEKNNLGRNKKAYKVDSDKIISNKMSEKLVNNKSTKNEDVVNENEEILEEDATKIDDSLMILLSLLAELKSNDISLDNIKDIDNSNVELINFIKETLNDITSLIGDEKMKELIPEGLIENSLNAITDLLEKAGLNDSNVSNLLANFKEIIDTDNELALNASKTVDEIVDLLTDKSENINKEVVNSSLVSKEVDVNSNIKPNELKDKTTSVIEDESKVVNDDNTGAEEFLGSNSEETSSNLTKDEKVLNAILNKNNTENTVVNRFAVFTNDYSISSSLKDAKSLMVNAHTAVHDVVNTIKYMSTEGIQELIVKVNPRELGELIISIVKDGDALRADIKASSKETYNLILQNSEDLKKYLGEQNLKVHNVDISLTKDATDNHHFFGESFKEGQNDNRRHSFSGNLNNETSFIEDEEDLPEELINSINMLV